MIECFFDCSSPWTYLAFHNLQPMAQETCWGADQDISQDPVIAAACTRRGIDADRLMQGIATQPVKDQLKANTEELVRRGGFGSPTLFVGDDMHSGNDRLPLVRLAAHEKTPGRSQVFSHPLGGPGEARTGGALTQKAGMPAS